MNVREIIGRVLAWRRREDNSGRERIRFACTSTLVRCSQRPSSSFMFTSCTLPTMRWSNALCVQGEGHLALRQPRQGHLWILHYPYYP